MTTTDDHDLVPHWSRHRRTQWLTALIVGIAAVAASGLLAVAVGQTGATTWSVVALEMGIVVALAGLGTAAATLRSGFTRRADDDAAQYATGPRAHLARARPPTISDPLVAHVGYEQQELTTLSTTYLDDHLQVVTAFEGTQACRLQSRWAVADQPEIRFVDGSDGVLASASGHRDGDHEEWVLTLSRRTLQLRSPVRRRPRRRTLRDPDSDYGYLATHRDAPVPRWVLVVAPGASPTDIVFCLWLLHLLDVRALVSTDTVWTSRGGQWADIPADLGPRVGPGGFGSRFAPHAPSGL